MKDYKHIKIKKGGSKTPEKVMGNQGKSVKEKVLKSHYTMRKTGNKKFPSK